MKTYLAESPRLAGFTATTRAPGQASGGVEAAGPLVYMQRTDIVALNTCDAQRQQ